MEPVLDGHASLEQQRLIGIAAKTRHVGKQGVYTVKRQDLFGAATKLISGSKDRLDRD